MTQEEKQLLLQDLCARLPYGVKIELMPITRGLCATLTPIILRDYFISDDVNYLPYLRPMSSMTDEERKEYEGFIIHRDHIYAQGQEWDIDCFSFGSVPRLIDWLNAHHFDYRGLIEKGLAIEVTKENNPYKE